MLPFHLCFCHEYLQQLKMAFSKMQCFVILVSFDIFHVGLEQCFEFNLLFISKRVFTFFRPMHNISISGDVPSERRRCVSEGKRGRGKLRPVSAVIYTTSRGRSDTEPSSPRSPYRASPSSSTKNVSLSESPKGKQSSVINRLMSRRRSKDGKEHIKINVFSIILFYLVYVPRRLFFVFFMHSSLHDKP